MARFPADQSLGRLEAVRRGWGYGYDKAQRFSTQDTARERDKGESKHRDLIKQNKEESQYSTRVVLLIKNATVTGRIRTCAISHSDSKSNVLDHSAIGTPNMNTYPRPD
ncbi:hypothetical protein J6590_047949 [Homalodisca vitripennis]|nr:hypothetical protein J6590_047949 [Homalodisca vitripennis]